MVCYNFDETVVAARSAAEKKGWSLFAVYNVLERLAAKGQAVLDDFEGSLRAPPATPNVFWTRTKGFRLPAVQNQRPSKR